MKTLLTVALFAFTALAQAEALYIHEHTVTKEDCTWIAGLVEETSRDRLEGTSQRDALVPMLTPQLLSSDAYRALLPLMILNVASMYREPLPTHANAGAVVNERAFKRCESYIGKPARAVGVSTE